MAANLLFVVLVSVQAVCGVLGVGADGATWRSRELAKVPSPALLYAPLTPFYSNLSLNVEPIPDLAKTAAGYGVNLVWTCGGMGQFYALTVTEREAINAAWASAGHANGQYVVCHVGTTVLEDAITLTKAASQYCDAIATVPPYYEQPSSIEQLIVFLKAIAEVSIDPNGNQLPLFYYHIPGSTHVNIQVADLLTAAATELPALLGIKYVSGDTLDWFNSVQAFNSSHVLMFAPEPKIQSFSLGVGRGTVLAEDFYAPTYSRMLLNYLRNDHQAAQLEQQWKYKVMAIFGKYGGGVAERALYRKIAGVDLGPRRLPTSAFNESFYMPMLDDLAAVGFFNQSIPHWPSA
eukprot:m.338344 g.338344  ORF g.338344 m.338344 type:complete len:348 (-) comp16084_c0_seq10:328-1371(-)